MPLKHQRLMTHLGERFGRFTQRKKFFRSLELIDGRDRVRTFAFEGRKVAIKDTQWMPGEGLAFKAFRRALLKHQRAIKNKTIKTEHYRIVTPKAYGRIGKYLVMEQIEGKPFSHYFHGYSKEEYEDVARAINELRKNIKKFRVTAFPLRKAIQDHDWMVIGKDKSGKWLIAPPYDLF